jgi:TolB-like protein
MVFGEASQLLQFNNFLIDADRQELKGAEGVIHVEPQVFDLLLYFAKNPSRVISKDELIEKIWKGRIVSDAALNSRINSARRAIGDSGKKQTLIRTIQRRGFLFAGDVTTRTSDRIPAAVGSTATLMPSPPKLAPPDKPSIAILPFQNLSGDPHQDYFADGVVEDIITGLSRIRWLFVIARNSSFTYRGQAVDVRRVGGELGVRYVLQGSVRKADDRVRISTQLIDAETGGHLWAERYDRELKCIFAVQDEITLSIVGAIEPSLRDAEIERVSRKRPDNLDAYDLVLRAIPQVYVAIPEQAIRAMPLLEHALALEVDYAAANSLLAWCHHILFLRAGYKEENRIAAIRHGRLAVAHGPDDATALSLGAFVIGMIEHDRATAFEAFDRALALSPSSAFALFMGSNLHAFAGKAERAIDWAERALRVSPVDRLAYVPHLGLAVANIVQGRYEEAANAARRSVQSNPNFSVSHSLLAAALVKLGRMEEAKSEAQTMLTLQRSFSVRKFLTAVDVAPVLAELLADAWHQVGLPP